ncbi:endolysin [Pbunavirus wadjak13]|uniref:Endolysin n=2 Tax=root TaxID=1 RepID=A0A977KH56_9CAUD|nr:endolysin [Pseudomonas phage Kara-mokiny kep-wari Wadjak 13]
MKITKDILITGTGCTTDRAIKWLDDVQAAMDKFQIESPRAIAAYLANIGVESGGLVSLVENLNYSAQGLANTWPRRYAVDPRVRPYVPNALANRLARNPVAIANNVYADRMGNGCEQDGDGWKYRGRGLIQLTGKSNYALFAEDSGMDVLEKPELLETPAGASMSSAWFFWRNRCIPMAESNNFSMVVKTINGAAPNDANHGQLRINRYVKTIDAINQGS